MKNEMGRACSMYRGVERCLQGFCGETSGKEITWKIQAYRWVYNIKMDLISLGQEFVD
jgi:hypothetical protein